MSFENAGLVICNPIRWRLASSGFAGDSKGGNGPGVVGGIRIEKGHSRLRGQQKLGSQASVSIVMGEGDHVLLC